MHLASGDFPSYHHEMNELLGEMWEMTLKRVLGWGPSLKQKKMMNCDM